MAGDPQKHQSIFRQPMQYDIALLFSVLFLVGVGIVMVYSASSALALKKFGTSYYFLKKQTVFAVLGIVVMVVSCHIPYRWFRSLTYPMLILAIGFLTVILISGFGYSAGGAKRWFRIAGFTFQPIEFARFSLVIYLAYSMSRKIDRIKEFSVGFLPHVLVLALFTVLIILQPDFGSVAIFGAITWIMLFVGGVRITYLLGSMVLMLPAAYYIMIGADYRIGRIMSFINPWQYSGDKGYQVIHSLLAFGTGGIWGAGIGKGYQKLFYLPEPHTDFIFSVIGEELGLVGVLIILGLYIVILWRGVSIARNSPDAFGSFVAVGLTSAIGLQICVNMGVALGLLPTKGLTLPFLSYGGTSLLMNMVSIGVLMNISSMKKIYETGR